MTQPGGGCSARVPGAGPSQAQLPVLLSAPLRAGKSGARGSGASVGGSAKDLSRHEPDDAHASSGGRRCPVCGIKLSAYNPNPYCWQHMIGHPWRGPTAKPKV